MRQSQSKEIDGFKWTVNQFTGRLGWRLLVVLIKFAGGAVAKVIEAWPKGKKETWNTSLLSAAVTDLVARLDEDDVENLTQRLLANTQVSFDGKNLNAKDHFDLVFQGRYFTLIKVLQFVLEVNYADPLSDFLSAALVDVGQE